LTSQSIIPPYRGTFGAARPAWLTALALPPGPMPPRQGLRPLKAWRYVGVFGPELMLCAATVRIGPARQTFWMIWDRAGVRLREGTALGAGSVRLAPGRLMIVEDGIEVDVRLEETPGIEAVAPAGRSYGWTRKQGGVPARGTVRIDGVALELDARAVIDDTAAYYPRHTTWRWSAGAGLSTDGRSVAWNLVSGVNDSRHGSERTVWIDGVSQEVGPCAFAEDLSAVDRLRFHTEAARERRENLLLVRSRYRQPFGTFTGELPDGTALAEGYGVMEFHDVHW
jgi:Protein of unknown function (DUF2804)